MNRFRTLALAVVAVGSVTVGPVAAQKAPKAPTKVAAGKFKTAGGPEVRGAEAG